MKPLVLSFSASRYLSSTFGQYIRKARLEKELRQVEVAKAISVDEMTIANWEKAHQLSRQFSKVKQACALLEIDYRGLVDMFDPSLVGEANLGAMRSIKVSPKTRQRGVRRLTRAHWLDGRTRIVSRQSGRVRS